MSTANAGVIGSGSATPTVTNNDSGTADDPVALLVGEGKKFKTIQDMARGKLASDEHIQRLEIENKALKEVAEGSGTAVLDRVSELLAKVNGQSATTQVSNQSKPESLTEEQVRAILHREQERSKVDGNISKFNEVVTKTFGEKAEETMRSKIASLGISGETFNRIVAENPESAMNLVGLKPVGNVASGASQGTVNTAALLGNQDTSRKNHAYYQKLRKELGADFFKPEIQSEMISERKRQGSEFYS